MKISDLVPDPQNRRAHNPRNLTMITDALQAVGAARSIVIDEGNMILAGNGVTEAAAVAGITKVRVIDAEGDELIAVRRAGLTAEQKRSLALFDNRTGELATWDVEQLQADLHAGLDLTPFFFEDELKTLLGNALADAAGPGGAGSLADRFGVPPFSVLDARQGYWQDRKRAWLAIGIESELGRGENLQTLSEQSEDYRDGTGDYAKRRGGHATPPPTVTQNPDGTLNYSGTKGQGKRFDRQRAASPGGSPRPAMQTKGGKTQRGDGRGRPLAGAGD